MQLTCGLHFIQDPVTASMDEPRPLSHVENGAWMPIRGQWKHLFGGFYEEGRSIEWHDFSIERPIDWSRSFHLQSLEITLNFCGEAGFGSRKSGKILNPDQLALYTTTVKPLEAERRTGHLHRFLTFEFSPEFLSSELRFVMDGLLPGVRKFCDAPTGEPLLLDLREVPSHLLLLRTQLLVPPVNAAAHTLWYQSKITEVMAALLFRKDAPAELFCERQRRMNRERCERVLFILERDMENPPSLEMLATEVDCSPFHLSRLFAQETGVSIPKALRTLRIERAGALILSSTASITEIAMQVGYSSLGAFNKAFAEHFQCSPGSYRTRSRKR